MTDKLDKRVAKLTPTQRGRYKRASEGMFYLEKVSLAKWIGKGGSVPDWRVMWAKKAKRRERQAKIDKAVLTFLAAVSLTGFIALCMYGGYLLGWEKAMRTQPPVDVGGFGAETGVQLPHIDLEELSNG